ncbi:MAG: hypothetical protein ABI366_11080 [Ginsengibacter sp.]
MYIDKILIDKAEPDLSIADTMRKRDAVIDDLKSFMYKQNFDKSFIAHKNPDFILVIESRVSDIIREGINNNDIRQELMNGLNDALLVEISMSKLKTWLKR